MWETVVWIITSEVFKALLGTFLGALLGIPAGLAVNHAWRHRQDRDRRNQLLSAVKLAVDYNAYLLNQIEDWIDKGGFTFFNLDLPLLESTASLKYELLDIDLCHQIDNLRFELTHLARKVDLLLKLEFDPSARNAVIRSSDMEPTSRYAILRPLLVDAIKTHVEPIRKNLKELESKLRSA